MVAWRRRRSWGRFLHPRLPFAAHTLPSGSSPLAEQNKTITETPSVNKKNPTLLTFRLLQPFIAEEAAATEIALKFLFVAIRNGRRRQRESPYCSSADLALLLWLPLLLIHHHPQISKVYYKRWDSFFTRLKSPMTLCSPFLYIHNLRDLLNFAKF